MKLAHSVRLTAWFLIGLNLSMAFGSIWIFMRMTPAIEFIIDRNVTSLQMCEEMLAALAILDKNETAEKPAVAFIEESFKTALQRAQKNITEKDEPGIIQEIYRSYPQAFAGDSDALATTVKAIKQLGTTNRVAMVNADKKARHFGNAGAWGIVFMASGVFLMSMLFLRNLKKNLVYPLAEIHAVTTAFQHGDSLRRCTGSVLPREIHQLYREINKILDKCSAHNFHERRQSGTSKPSV